MQVPQFCSNPDCRFHDPQVVKAHPEPFCRHCGSYTTLVVGEVQRFQCQACGKTFGERTFLLDYYTKKTLDYKDLLRAVSASESVSSMARTYRCSVGSIENRLERMSRNGILFHTSCLHKLTLKEGLTADGFESFDVSQYHPNNINLLLGSQSQFLYAVTHNTLRRKGRMTAEQKSKRTQLEGVYKPPRGAAVAAFAGLVAEIPGYWDQTVMPQLEFKTDQHKAYPFALQRVTTIAEAMREGAFLHQSYSSKIARTVFNPLFSANYYDRELRKDLAAFHRESVCYTRNVSNGLARLVCHLVYHNYQKDFRVKWGVTRFPKHAVVAGVPQEAIDSGLERLFTERLFYTHYTVSAIWRKIWNREYRTPLKRRPEYLPKFARVKNQQGSLK